MPHLIRQLVVGHQLGERRVHVLAAQFWLRGAAWVPISKHATWIGCIAPSKPHMTTTLLSPAVESPVTCNQMLMRGATAVALANVLPGLTALPRSLLMCHPLRSPAGHLRFSDSCIMAALRA